MQNPTIIIDIAPDGNVKLKVVGAVGPTCKELSKPIEEAIGIVTADTPTPEYYQQVGQQHQQKRQR